MKKVLLFVFVASLALSCKKDNDDSINHPPTIYGLPVNMEDIALSYGREDKLFREFAEPLDINGKIKLNFHPEFYLPLGYKVKAVSEGVVTRIDELDGPNDLNLFVRPDDAPKWRVMYEHINNVTVKVGDRITIGQEVGEVSPFKGNLGKIAFLVLHGVEGASKGGNVSYCPFMLLDSSVKSTLLATMQTHIQQWEANNGNVYDEENWVEIGCARESLTEVEAAPE
jgi:hypothetical protein